MTQNDLFFIRVNALSKKFNKKQVLSSLNINCYQNLLEFSNKLNPLDSNFPNIVTSELIKIFNLAKATLDIYADNDILRHNMSASIQEEHYQKDTILLSDEKERCIGQLTLCSNKNISSIILEDSIIHEISKSVEKALRIHLRYYGLKTNFSMFQNMMSHLPLAIILCDSNFHILHINQAAINSFEFFGKKVSILEAERILKDKLLPNYFTTGAKEYSLSVKEVHFQLSIRNHILQDKERDTYITFYQITVNSMSKMNETKWNEYLISKELTKRECEVSNLMRLGLTNDEVAVKLNISINTMKRHRENIYRKLNINRINQLNVLYENNIKKI